jgi:type II secretory pathway pseudopilin PulG
MRSLGHHPTRGRFARARRGMTLLEILVSIAIMMLMTAVLVPTLSGVLALEQRNAARKLALMYEQLHDEAILRNRTFRFVFNVDGGSYRVEASDSAAAIFTDPEARLLYEEREQERLEDMEPEERQLYKEEQAQFKAMQGSEFSKEVKLPENTVFKMVYTPQYEDPVERRDPDDRRSKDEDRNIAYSYLFANGFAEYTVIQLVEKDAEDDDEGFTLIVDPLSGRVELHYELMDHHDRFDFIPDDGPSLS